MPRIPLQPLPPTSTDALAARWLDQLAERLADPATDRALLCRETLLELAYPAYRDRWEETVHDERTPMGTRLALAALDPRQITLEPEYYGDCDQTRFQRVKPTAKA